VNLGMISQQKVKIEAPIYTAVAKISLEAYLDIYPSYSKALFLLLAVKKPHNAHKIKVRNTHDE
jgi:hypothetical protein